MSGQINPVSASSAAPTLGANSAAPAANANAAAPSAPSKVRKARAPQPPKVADSCCSRVTGCCKPVIDILNYATGTVTGFTSRLCSIITWPLSNPKKAMLATVLVAGCGSYYLYRLSQEDAAAMSQFFSETPHGDRVCSYWNFLRTARETLCQNSTPGSAFALGSGPNCLANLTQASLDQLNGATWNRLYCTVVSRQP